MGQTHRGRVHVAEVVGEVGGHAGGGVGGPAGWGTGGVAFDSTVPSAPLTDTGNAPVVTSVQLKTRCSEVPPDASTMLLQPFATRLVPVSRFCPVTVKRVLRLYMS